MVGVVLFATLALVPPMLQTQMQYPVVLTGLVTAPRGAGTMIAMIVVGRLVSRFDPRMIIASGLALTAFSLWQMTQFSLQMNSTGRSSFPASCRASASAWSGCRFPRSPSPPCPRICATKAPPFFNLLRNVGSSIGISVVMFLLTQNTQTLHASIAEHITLYNIMGNQAAAAAHFNTAHDAGAGRTGRRVSSTRPR